MTDFQYFGMIYQIKICTTFAKLRADELCETLAIIQTQVLCLPVPFLTV
jgi:hypothetical protein